jgi:hypothetical protein
MCAVCRRSLVRSDPNHLGDAFICAECQADATQFIDIQDLIWCEANQTADATPNGNDQLGERTSLR